MTKQSTFWLKSIQAPPGYGRKWMALALVLLLSPLVGFTQNISGKILDEDGAGLEGATIIVQGTTTGTFSQEGGGYTIEAAIGDVLVVSYYGFVRQEMPITGSSMDVVMVANVQSLDAVILTGYSSEKKKDLLGAVSVIDLDAVASTPNPNVMQTIQGRSPGVFVDLSGDPGQGARVRIRGVSTLGNNDALYIVDGVPIQPFVTNETGAGDLNWGLSWLNPNDIASVQVLKDASSASIYGSRASNGVVIITTKQPQANQAPRITFNARYSVENWNDRDQLTNNRERGILEWQGAVNDGADPDATGIYTYDWNYDPSLGAGVQGNGVPVLNNINYPEWLDEGDQLRPAGHPSSIYGGDIEVGTDWFDQIAQTGIMQNYDVSFAQSTNKGGVYFSVNYLDQEGVVIGTDYTRVGARLNSNYSFLDDRVTIGQNLAVSSGERAWMDTGFGGTPEQGPYRVKSILPVYTEDGRFAGPPGGGFSDRDNPLAVATDNRDDRISNIKVFGNVFANIQFTDELSFRTNFGIDYDAINSTDIFRTYSRGFLANNVAELQETNRNFTNWVFNNTLTYAKSVGNHNFSVLAGTEAVKNTVSFFSATGKEFALETVDYFQLSAASGEKNASGGETGFSLFSYFGKVNYSFASKYLMSATLRRDGSSRFGINNRFAVFPAASAGWRISEEAFMSNVSAISNLKIRVGWGQTGNQDILNDARFSLYQSVYAPANNVLPWGGGCAEAVCPDAATSYDIGNNDSGILPSGFLATQTGNDDLRWETQTEINVGFDFGLWSQTITGSFEVFQKQTDDILIQPTTIGAYGDGSRRFVNGASMQTTGWELGLQYNAPGTPDFYYTIGVNLSAFDAIITDIPEDLYSSFPGNEEQNIIGQAPNALFGYRSDGIFQNAEEVAAHADQVGARVGALRFMDLNDDGVINVLDQEYDGANGVAAINFGLNPTVYYKSFDFSLFVWGALGRKSIPANLYKLELGTLDNGENGGVNQLDAWSFTNTGSHIPAVSNSNRPFGFSHEYDVRNGNFLAFRQATVGYTLPQTSSLSKIFSSLRVYVTGENLGWIVDRSGANQWVGTGFSVEDVAVSSSTGRSYPKPMRLTGGITIGF